MQETPSSQSITIKIISTLLLVLADLIINSFVQASFTLSYQSNPTTNFYFIPIQIIINCLMIIMVIILLWQTFPLRYGLLGTLFKQFKWNFIMMITFIVVSVIERGIRLSYISNNYDTFKQIDLWKQNSYVAFYYIRYLLYPVFYGLIVSFCMRIIQPSFYKPNRWIK